MRTYVVVILACASMAGCSDPTATPKQASPTIALGGSELPNVGAPEKDSAVEVPAKVVKGPEAGDPKTKPVVETPPRKTNGTDADTPQSVTADSPSPKKELTAKAPAPEFDIRLQKLLAMRDDTNFPGAIRECRALQKIYQDPEQTKVLLALMLELIEIRKSSSGLYVAIQSLASPDDQVLGVARRELSAGGKLERLFLRHAVRTSTEKVAQQAAQILAGLGDTASHPILFDKLKANPASPLGQTCGQALMAMAKDLDGKILLDCFEIVRMDAGFAATIVADVLQTVFFRVHEEKEKAFNQAVGHPEAIDLLRNYVEAALCSANPVAVDWGCKHYPMEGLCARYFPNTSFQKSVLERKESRVEIGIGGFPLPDGRQDDVSARWTGILQVYQEGPYNFSLACQGGAPQSGEVWVSTDCVLKVSPQQPSANASTHLLKGWHPIRIDYVKNKGGNDQGGIRFDWSGPKTEQGRAAVMRTGPWPEWIADLSKAASDLNSASGAIARAAEGRLASSGDLGIVFIRHAFKTGTGVGGRRIMDLLCRLVKRIKPQAFPDFYQDAMDEKAEKMNPHISILCAALWQLCREDADTFNKLVADPMGYTKLQAHVTAALASEDKTVVARAWRNGYPFAPLMPGLHARYYNDPNFGQLALERIDGQIRLENRSFPLAKERQDNISAEWNGAIAIPKAGEYAFFAQAESHVWVYVDGINVTDVYTKEGHGRIDRVRLEPGLYPFQVVFMQNKPGAGSMVKVSWEGPDIGRQPISGVFQTAPWDEKLVEVDQAMADLKSADEARASAARKVLEGVGKVGHLYLRNAIQYGSAPTMETAATMVAEFNDEKAAPVLLARLKNEKDEKLRDVLTHALCKLARGIEPGTFSALYEAACAKNAEPMNPYVAILCSAIFDGGLDAAKFDKRVGKADGYDTLSKHVKGALTSSSQDTVRRAQQYGLCFLPHQSGLAYEYYQGAWSGGGTLPDFSKLKAVNSGVVPTFSLTPSKSNDNFAFKFSGQIRIPKDGEYTFFTTSDDGSQLFIDGVLVVNNDGAHGPVEQSGKVKLVAGLRSIAVTYCQGGAGLQLSVSWEAPGMAKAEIPAVVLFHTMKKP